MTDQFDRGATEVAVEDGAERLEAAAETLYTATLRFEKAEEAWDRLRLMTSAKIYHQSNGKPPPLDVRAGMVLELHGEKDIYLEFIAAKAESEALDKRFRALQGAVSARQSLLRRIS